MSGSVNEGAQVVNLGESANNDAALDEWYDEAMRASQIEDWQAELSSLESDVKAMRAILAEKQLKADSLRARLGLPIVGGAKMQAVREKSAEILQNANAVVWNKVQNVKESDRYKLIEAKTLNVIHKLKFSRSASEEPRPFADADWIDISSQFGPVSNGTSNSVLDSDKNVKESVVAASGTPYSIATDYDEDEELTLLSKPPSVY